MGQSEPKCVQEVAQGGKSYDAKGKRTSKILPFSTRFHYWAATSAKRCATKASLKRERINVPDMVQKHTLRNHENRAPVYTGAQFAVWHPRLKFDPKGRRFELVLEPAGSLGALPGPQKHSGQGSRI